MNNHKKPLNIKKGKQGFQKTIKQPAIPTAAQPLPPVGKPKTVASYGISGDDKISFVTMPGTNPKMSRNPLKRAEQSKTRKNNINTACEYYLGYAEDHKLRNTHQETTNYNIAKHTPASELENYYNVACYEAGVNPFTDYNSWTEEQQQKITQRMITLKAEISGGPYFAS